MPPAPVTPSLAAPSHDEQAALLAQLDEGRARTWRLVAPLSDVDLRVAHHPVMGPVAWDVGHMTQQADQWLVQRLGARPETRRDANDTYDAYRHPRATRAGLPLLTRTELKTYWDEVRAAVAAVLAAPPSHPDDPLWQDHYGLKMVIQHEAQHQETILQHAAAMPRGRYAPPARPGAPAERVVVDGFAYIDGGAFPMGAARRTPWTYDNEWPLHQVDVPAFWLQRAPVTNAQFLAFLAADGYDDARGWDPQGFAFHQAEGWTAPMYWEQRDGTWFRRTFDVLEPLAPHAPVMHVTWYEADAFARWAGARLPREVEWEKAATWDPVREQKRDWPWGDAPWTPAHANLDQRRYGVDPVGSHPAGATPQGVHQLVGDVWEWLDDDFVPYPGYVAFPYEDYSQRFFGPAHKMLRGGSWATRPLLRLGTFRNWDLPVRRQIFAGLRLAVDARTGPDNPPRIRFS